MENHKAFLKKPVSQIIKAKFLMHFLFCSTCRVNLNMCQAATATGVIALQRDNPVNLTLSHDWPRYIGDSRGFFSCLPKSGA